MGLWLRFVRGLRGLVERREADRALTDEVRHYIAEAEAELIANGHAPEEARRLVRLRYGDELAAREDVRSFGWEAWIESLTADLRLSARNLRRSPGFTTIVVLTLGLGIGAATAIFSAVRPVLLEPLPYPGANRILTIEQRAEDGSTVQTAFRTFLEVSTRSGDFQSLTVSKPWQPTLTGDQEPERLEGQSVSAAYFDVLGLTPRLGPGFDAAQDRPGGARQLVIGDALWRRRFLSDPGVVGRTVRLDGDEYTVVGVMPAGFENVTAPLAQAWTLLQYDPVTTDFDTREWGHHLDMMGRARAGVGPTEARQALDAMAGDPVVEFPRPEWATTAGGFSVERLRDTATADARPTMLAFVGAVVLLLAVTCANLTLLLLARGTRRHGEFALRVALGAGRARLARYLLTESLVLALLGGIVGIALAHFGLSTLIALSPPSVPRLDAVRLDGSAMALAMSVTTVVGVIFGLAPGLHRSERATRSIGDLGRGPARRSRSVRRVLVVTEVAMAMTLLVGAGLVVRSTHALLGQPLGFDPTQRVVLQVYATGLEHGDAVTHRYFDRALDAVRSVSGVVSAVETSQLPLSGEQDVYGVTPDQDGAVPGPAFRFAVTPGYLATMGIRVDRGRALSVDDTEDAPAVAVVSTSLARRLFGGEDPLGRRVQVGAERPGGYTIVGVADDVKHASLEADASDAIYVTSHQWHWADRVRWIVVEAEGDPSALVPTIRRAVWSIDADQPVVRAQTMSSVVARSEARRRFVLIVISAFALAATVLAVVGLYGVVAGSVAEQLPELGVRAALGASNERIVGMVIQQGMGLTAVGILIGLVGSAAASAMVAIFLFRVSRLDPLTYAGVVAVLVVGAALSCIVPALRAARVDPVRTLKAE